MDIDEPLEMDADVSSHSDGSDPPPSRGQPLSEMADSSHPSVTSPSSYSRPSTSHRTPPSSAQSSARPTPRPRSDSMKVIAKYPFLQECAAQRPAVYRSPYAPGGGITEPWWPLPREPRKARRPRAGSLAQDFLMKRTPSQREAVKGHVRTISTEKATYQQQEAERRYREQQQRHLARQALGPPPPSPPLLPNPLFGQPGAMPPSPTFSELAFSHGQPFPPLLDDPVLAAPFSPSLHSRIPATAANGAHQVLPISSAANGHMSSNLLGAMGSRQMSTPQDFQMQMQRDMQQQQQPPQQQQQQQPPPGSLPPTRTASVTKPAPTPLMTHDRSSYHAFVRDLQSGRGGLRGSRPPHGPRGSAVLDDDDDEMTGMLGPSGTEGSAGSPLRRGMRAAGGEMLPMMQDHPF